MATIEISDLVLVDGPAGRFHALVTGVRLGRLVVERCDGRPAGPVSPRQVVEVYKPAGAPDGAAPAPGARLRPTAQLKLDLG